MCNNYYKMVELRGAWMISKPTHGHEHFSEPVDMMAQNSAEIIIHCGKDPVDKLKVLVTSM